ncbi:LuxR C-terminal-related transcriptional regulator [Streptomyces sp. NPDC003006]
MSADTTTASYTRREKQVVQGLAEGLTDHEIAHRLNREVRTVRHHITWAAKKVGAKGQVRLVDCSYSQGLLTPPASEIHTIYVPDQLRELIPLVARGMKGTRIAIETNRAPVHSNRDIRQLMQILRARTRPHLVTRALQYGLLKTAPRTVRT